jgi:hypothetical protein
MGIFLQTILGKNIQIGFFLTTSKVGLLIFQLSITEVSSALHHFNM